MSEPIQFVLDRLQHDLPDTANTRQLWLHEHRSDVLSLMAIVGQEQAAELLGMQPLTINVWFSRIQPDPADVWTEGRSADA